MKILTMLIAFIYGSLLLVVLPFIFIRLNLVLNLPIYSFFITKLLGVIFILIGVLTWLYCTGLFHFIGKGTPVPIDPPKRLVIKGIYQRTRNPMYMSVLVIIFSYFLVFGHVLLLLYVLLLAVFFHLFVTLYEEPTLKKIFGGNYIEYCKKTPRWI